MNRTKTGLLAVGGATVGIVTLRKLRNRGSEGPTGDGASDRDADATTDPGATGPRVEDRADAATERGDAGAERSDAGAEGSGARAEAVAAAKHAGAAVKHAGFATGKAIRARRRGDDAHPAPTPDGDGTT